MSKRLNPKTGKPFKEGDKRSDGYRFRYYSSKKDQNGLYLEKWQSEKSRFRDKIAEAIRNTRDNRFRDSSHPAKIYKSNIDIDFLISIFPKDKRCPVFGYKMDWGGETTKEKDTSPSLDRINPMKGYTKDNVQWISNKVNRMKSDQTLEMVIRLGDWAERVKKDGIESSRTYNEKL